MKWLVVAGLVMSACRPVPHPTSEVDVEEMRRLLTPAPMSADEWEAYCIETRPSRAGRCAVVVQIDCPPDCGVYRLVMQDTLARRVW